MTEEKKSARVSRGPLIVAALAEALPTAMTRRELLESPELAAKFGTKKLEGRLLEGAAKALGLLIKNKQVGEMLIIRPSEDYGAGLVAISVNLARLTDAWNSWKINKDAPRILQTPTQEGMVQRIIDDTRGWSKDVIEEDSKVRSKDVLKDDSLDQRGDTETFTEIAPIIIRDINVVHGSESFDILMFVLYRRPDEFLTYIREVVQRVPCVERTHTMQIAPHSFKRTA